MKKAIMIFICVLCFLMIIGCGKSDKSTDKTSSEKTTSSEVVDSSATYDIKTDVTTFKYAEVWKDKVETDVTDKKVSFTQDGTPVFDLVFEECDGYLLGTYSGTPIYIIEYPVETDEQAQMIEDINVILENLLKDENFVLNKE